MEKLKILVVDDKHVVGDMFDITLGFYGHKVTCITNPEEAISLIQKEQFDIAFLDLIMPKTDGVDLLGRLRKLSPDLPVVLMSGYTVEDKWTRGKELGAASCLRKPFEYEDIRKVVKEAIGKDI